MVAQHTSQPEEYVADTGDLNSHTIRTKCEIMNINPTRKKTKNEIDNMAHIEKEVQKLTKYYNNRGK